MSKFISSVYMVMIIMKFARQTVKETLLLLKLSD
jgi:hypothetical protein